jgi:hypothetical protein
MPKLSPDELTSRLRFDWKIVQQMTGPLLSVQGFKSLNDLADRKNPITKSQHAHRAVAYRVEYRVRSLVAEGEFHDRFEVSIDLLSGGDYPFSRPACFVVSRPIPWSPHFLPLKGAICLGELWTNARGSITLGHLILHIMRLLNFDEPDREPAYGGWNPEAVRYWRQGLNRRPITAGLAYPVLPPELTHGLNATNRPLFRPALPSVRVKSIQPVFRPVGRQPS